MRSHRPTAFRENVQVRAGGHGGNVELSDNFLYGDSASLFNDLLHLLAPLFGQRTMLFGSDSAFHDLIVNDRLKRHKKENKEDRYECRRPWCGYAENGQFTAEILLSRNLK